MRTLIVETLSSFYSLLNTSLYSIRRFVRVVSRDDWGIPWNFHPTPTVCSYGVTYTRRGPSPHPTLELTPREKSIPWRTSPDRRSFRGRRTPLFKWSRFLFRPTTWGYGWCFPEITSLEQLLDPRWEVPNPGSRLFHTYPLHPQTGLSVSRLSLSYKKSRRWIWGQGRLETPRDGYPSVRRTTSGGWVVTLSVCLVHHRCGRTSKTCHSSKCVSFVLRPDSNQIRQWGLWVFDCRLS